MSAELEARRQQALEHAARVQFEALPELDPRQVAAADSEWPTLVVDALDAWVVSIAAGLPRRGIAPSEAIEILLSQRRLAGPSTFAAPPIADARHGPSKSAYHRSPRPLRVVPGGVVAVSAPRVSFDREFFSSAQALGPGDARRVFKAIDQLSVDPNHPSLNLEPLKDGGPRLHTIRVSQEARILLAKEMVGYYEAVQEFVVAEVEPGATGEPDGEGAPLVVGCGALHVMWDDLAEIRTLAVDPAWRGHRVGTRSSSSCSRGRARSVCGGCSA